MCNQGKTKFKSEAVTGSKQKHIEVSSAAGSTEYSQYSLNQGPLMQNQLIYHNHHSAIVCIYWNIDSYYYLPAICVFNHIYPVFIY